MTLRQFKCLIACSECRDLTAASVRLSLSPPSITRQLKSLEDELGTQLIYLRARPLMLTLRGEALVHQARRILALVQGGVEDLRRNQRRLVGTIRLALSVSSGHRLVSEILKDFAGVAPEVRLDIRDAALPSQITQLQRGEIDVALLFPAWSAPGVSYETLLHECVTVVLPSNHRFARRANVRLIELSEERWLVFYKPNSGRVGTDFYQACERAGFTPVIAGEIQSQLVRIAHVVQGDGLTLLPCSYDLGVQKGLRRVRIDPEDLNIPSTVMWKEHDTREIVRAFLASVRRTVSRIYLDPRVGSRAPDFDIFFLPAIQVFPGSAQEMGL